MAKWIKSIDIVIFAIKRLLKPHVAETANPVDDVLIDALVSLLEATKTKHEGGNHGAN